MLPAVSVFSMLRGASTHVLQDPGLVHPSVSIRPFCLRGAIMNGIFTNWYPALRFFLVLCNCLDFVLLIISSHWQLMSTVEFVLAFCVSLLYECLVYMDTQHVFRNEDSSGYYGSTWLVGLSDRALVKLFRHTRLILDQSIAKLHTAYESFVFLD